MTEERLSAILRYCLFAGAGLFVAVYVYVAASRMGYPYELEWMEGAMADHVSRVLAGKPLYVEPSFEFTPFIYTPLYFYVSAVASWIHGEGLLPLRWVSFMSSLGVFLLIFQFVRRETGSRAWGGLAAALFAAAYKPGGAWLDLARVDALFLLLLLAGVYVLRFYPSTSGQAAAAVLFSLSFLTKQTALMVAAPLAVYGLVALRRGRRLVFPAALAGIVGASSWWLDRATGGWYGFYVFDLPRQHGWESAMGLRFWTEDLARPMAIALGLTLYHLYHLARQKKGEAVFHALLLAGALVASWISRLHSGGYGNVLLPAYAVVAIGFGLGLHAVWQTLAASGLDRKRFEAPVYLFCVIQFVALAYNPFQEIPTKSDVVAGESLVRTLEGLEGEVWLPMHGHLATLAGKKRFSHYMALEDVLRGDDEELRAALSAEVAAAIGGGRLEAIVMDSPRSRDWRFWGILEEGYNDKGSVLSDESALWPRTGVKTRPQQLYVLRP